MISFTSGNLLDSPAEAVVNTVNTVGVMGKGIALMFKERFPQNFQLYSRACTAKTVRTGKMFVTESGELSGPKWIVNFPTKQHWRGNSRIEWIEEGLDDLRRWIEVNGVKSIALPPLGAGNGGLNWGEVKALIERRLSDVQADVIVYEPVGQYQNVQKRSGVEKLTPARALIAELVRQYSILGMDCSLLEIQKLAWFLERSIARRKLSSPLKLNYRAHYFGPYAENLKHMLDSLDGSYIHCEKRIADAGPLESVWFNDSKKTLIGAFLQSEAKEWQPALDDASALIDGFQSPYGMELLATCDWLLYQVKVEPSVEGLRKGLHAWPSEGWAVTRKARIFSDDVLGVALARLVDAGWVDSLSPSVAES